MTLAAAICTALTIVLARPTGAWVARERLLITRSWSMLPVRWLTLIGSTLGAGAMAVGMSPNRLIVTLTTGGGALFAVRQVRAERMRRRAQERRGAVAEAVGLMAAELRAGVLPQRILHGLAPDFQFLTAASRAARLGGSVSSALRAASRESGCEQLADLSGAWMVAERAGVPLARVLDRLEAAARDDREIEREVQSGVAPARATGRLMAVLPVVGLTMGSSMGADPISLLTGTVPGALCLAAGSACACTGVAWVNRIAAAAERAP